MDTRAGLSDFNPIEQEILNVYWSDHCRHTTFNTHITDIEIESRDAKFKAAVEHSLSEYKKQRESVHGARLDAKPITLMDLATISGKFQRAECGLENLVDDKIEFNACTISTDIDGEKYRLSFKNETHNSPTEKYPFDGAATALGGTIRDILASRAVPYQGIRTSGSADPTTKETMEEEIAKDMGAATRRRPFENHHAGNSLLSYRQAPGVPPACSEKFGRNVRTPGEAGSFAITLEGKLPQSEITTKAARGFSSYARAVNATVGCVQEFYHPGYAAKRLEGGLVAGFVKAKHARVEELVPGDIILLIGLKTGRDGIGAAADSSTTQDKKIDMSACPIGYPAEGRKLIELYGNPEFLKLVKKCNDFGAGGVSVAVGELADSLDIYLDRVPLSVADLGPMEIALSETQERMAAGISKGDLDKMLELTNALNLEATVVADVTDSGYMNMFYNGEKVVGMSRAFLDTAGDVRTQSIVIQAPNGENALKGKDYADFRQMVLDTMSDLENCSQQGLALVFDQVDEHTVLQPFEGTTKKSPTQGSVVLIPVKGNKSRVTIATFGFDPYVSSWSAYYGGVTARLECIARVIALGGNYRDVYLTDQEYYGTCSTPEKFGLPFAALLGANDVCRAMGIAAIGGKDSMSGSYKDIDVPPTLISYAFAPADIKTVGPQLFKKAGSSIGVIEANMDDLAETKAKWDYFLTERGRGNIIMARAIGAGGIIGEVCKAAFGNEIGFSFNDDIAPAGLNDKSYGSLLIEIKDGVKPDEKMVRLLGRTTDEKTIQHAGQKVCLKEVLLASEARLNSVFPIR